VNISRQGAHLRGVRGKLRMGGQVLLRRYDTAEEFTIVWTGEERNPGASTGEIGVCASNPSSTFWSDVLEPQQAGGDGQRVAIFTSEDTVEERLVLSHIL
jgi:hypothetical protein